METFPKAARRHTAGGFAMGKIDTLPLDGYTEWKVIYAGRWQNDP